MKKRSDPAARALRRKILLMALALVLVLSSHLRPVFRITVQGEALPGRYSLQQARSGEAHAREIADLMLAQRSSWAAPTRSASRKSGSA